MAGKYKGGGLAALLIRLCEIASSIGDKDERSRR